MSCLISRIIENCLSPYLTPSDLLGGCRSCGSDNHQRSAPIRVTGCPFERLHSTHRTSNDCHPTVDSEVLGEGSLRPYDISDCNDREVAAPSLIISWIYRSWSGASLATTEDVCADHKEAICVKSAAWSYEVVPPAGRSVARASFPVRM